MRPIPMLPSALVLAVLTVGLTGPGPANAAPEAPVSIASRVSADGVVSLLVEVRTGAGTTLDGLRLAFPRRLPGAPSGRFPSGWGASVSDRTLGLAGPPAAPPLFLRIDLGRAELPARMGVELLSSGRVVWTTKAFDVPRLPPVQRLDTLNGLLQLPPRLFPGAELSLAVLDPKRTPLAGVWQIAGRTARLMDVAGAPRLALNLPGALGPGDALSVRYLDPFGELLVDVPATPGVTLVDPPPLGRLAARLTGASPRGFAGQLVCACGSFPGERAWGGLRLDGREIGAPVAASDFVVWVRVPEDAAAGPHTLSGDPGAGFPEGDGATFKALVVSGSIDQNRLWRGEATTMRLRILGDDAALALRLRNDTPGIITLEGGDQQVVTTSGGADNALERQVRGVQRGNFSITYELNTDPCPCAGEPPPVLVGGGPAIAANPPATTSASTPTQRESTEENLCGPDVTAEYIAALQRAFRRFQQLPDSERGWYDGMGFLYRNGNSIDMRARPARPAGSEQNEDNQGNVLCPRGVCAGNNPVGQKTLMLGGVCLPEHVGNDIMYGFTGAMLDVPWKILIAGGHGHQLLAYGGFEPGASHAAYSFGMTLADHLSGGGSLDASSLAELMLRSTFYTAQTGMRWKNTIEAIYGEYEWLNLCRPCPSGSAGLLRDFTRSSWSLDDGGSQPGEDPPP